jgi:hypothetical protein
MLSARPKTLRERGSDTGNSRAATSSERLAAAHRYAVEPQAAAADRRRAERA